MSTTAAHASKGFLSFTLHAHLPYVVNHGTWPHGMEWLHEAAAETYLPLLRVLAGWSSDGIALRCNLNLSPILLEQLAHPVFVAEFPQLSSRARSWPRGKMRHSSCSPARATTQRQRGSGTASSTQALEDFQALDGDIVAGFRHFHETGLIEIITCAATHGYLPLLGTDESVRAQLAVGGADA